MNISLCMISTNVTNRLKLLEDTILSLNKCNNIFTEKILSIDVFENENSLNGIYILKRWINIEV